MVKVSLIIAFYKRIDYLKLVLAGLSRQSFKDFEIVIADDGSTIEIVKDIESLSREIPCPLIHVWHEDKGFRKNKILNKAIVSSNSDYLIFIDGDCVPHSKFIEEHFAMRRENLCLTGRRVNLSERITKLLTAEKIKNGFLEKNMLTLFSDSIFGKSAYVEKGFYFKSIIARKLVNRKNRGLLGCNFSVSKKNMLEINGFDERYEAPSIGEDSDVQFRLEKLGVKIASLNNIAVQYHLYHKLQERIKENLLLFEEVKKANQYYTSYGINQ